MSDHQNQAALVAIKQAYGEQLAETVRNGGTARIDVADLGDFCRRFGFLHRELRVTINEDFHGNLFALVRWIPPP